MQKVIEEDLDRISHHLKEFKNKIEGKSFLVTGGAGFLGSWFCDVLNLFGARIICVDNFISGTQKNLERLSKNKNFKFIKADVCNFKTEEKIDYIVHMASPASPSFFEKYSIEMLDANILGTKKLLELANEKEIEAMIFTSSSEVYGNPPDSMVPTPEDYYGYVNSFGFRSPYDEGKRAAEAYCHSFFKTFGTPIRIARIFNTYGPRLDVKNTSQYGRAVAKFIVQALKNKPVTVYGDGSQTRSFCYVTDQIEGLVKLLLVPNIDGRVFNIGSDDEISVLELAKKIIELSNSKSKIVFEPLPKDDPRRRCPDLRNANRFLNYRPKINLEEGLRRTIEWIKENS